MIPIPEVFLVIPDDLPEKVRVGQGSEQIVEVLDECDDDIYRWNRRTADGLANFSRLTPILTLDQVSVPPSETVTLTISDCPGKEYFNGPVKLVRYQAGTSCVNGEYVPIERYYFEL